MTIQNITQAAENLIEEINKKYSIKGGLSQVDAVGERINLDH